MTLFLGAPPQESVSFRLPTPYSDELLYSVIARAAYRNGHWSPKGLMGAAFGDRGVLACPDLPSQLSLLTGTAGEQWQLSSADIALRYTLFGYYTHYLGASERERFLGMMGGKSAYLHLRLGICAGGVRAPSRFFLCPVCTELDIEQHGETYWRRSHHLPGVVVCPVHAVSLLETNVPFRPVGRHEHIHARAQYLEQGVSVLSESAAASMELLALAQSAARLLDAPVCDGGPLHDYREQLKATGFKGASGVNGLWRCLAKRFGHEVLQPLFRSSSGTSAPTWLWELFRKPRRPLHPLKHLLVQQILLASEVRAEHVAVRSGKTWGIFKNQDLRRRAQALSQKGLTVNAVATQLGVDWNTANRLLQPIPAVPDRVHLSQILSDRKSWCAVADKYPGCGRAQLRRKAPALYARLYRNDREWMRQRTESLSPKSARPRVSWPDRDAALAKSVQVLAMATRQRKPLRRVSVSHVLGVLGARTLVSRNGAKLPSTQAALAQHCESVEDFQLRRIQSEQEADGWFPRPVWRVLRAAGLNPARFSDRGLGIVERARQLLEVANPRPGGRNA
jgi:hypothetical protein